MSLDGFVYQKLSLPSSNKILKKWSFKNILSLSKKLLFNGYRHSAFSWNQFGNAFLREEIVFFDC